MLVNWLIALNVSTWRCVTHVIAYLMAHNSCATVSCIIFFFKYVFFFYSLNISSSLSDRCVTQTTRIRSWESYSHQLGAVYSALCITSPNTTLHKAFSVSYSSYLTVKICRNKTVCGQNNKKKKKGEMRGVSTQRERWRESDGNDKSGGWRWRRDRKWGARHKHKRHGHL